MRSGARWSLQVAGAAVAAAAVVVPAQVAHAATGTTVGSFQHNQIVYQGGDGQQNKPTVTFSDGEIVISDVVPLTIPSNATPNCRAVPGNAMQVRCALTNIHTMAILLGDRDDYANIKSFPVTLNLDVTAGDGNDTVMGPAIAGDISAWTNYIGGPGADWLHGGGRPEAMFGDAGADTMDGGGGVDAVSYQYSPEPVTADADGVAGDDGAATERDTIGADVEKIVGSRFADSLTAVGRTFELWGVGGNDTLTGGIGPDNLYGGEGDDTIYGNGGRNTLLGQHGDDKLYGGNDVLNNLLGGVGYDRCFAGAGGAGYFTCEVVA